MAIKPTSRHLVGLPHRRAQRPDELSLCQDCAEMDLGGFAGDGCLVGGVDDLHRLAWSRP